jgi:hypothetical protein
LPALASVPVIGMTMPILTVFCGVFCAAALPMEATVMPRAAAIGTNRLMRMGNSSAYNCRTVGIRVRHFVGFSPLPDCS